MDFHQKWSLNWLPKTLMRRAFWHLKPILFRRGSFLGPLARFGSLLAPFWSLLAPFWLHFGVFFIKSHAKSCFLAPEFAKHLQIAICTPNKGKSSHEFLLPLGPERNLAAGNLDPLRARRRPGRVRMRPLFLYQHSP